tara:strand:+ start:76 stop:564 length:489 start_codon:yes stop_codon:yes gene_type:complete
MHNFKIETSLKIVFFVSVVAIVSAYFIEYILGHQPCNLCLIERIPYGLSIVLISLKYIFKLNERFIILLLILIFVFSLIVSLYHFGIEQGYFDESAVCGIKNAAKIISKEELLEQLQEKIVSCKDVTFRIFGFSLTLLNIMLSIILLFLVSIAFKYYEKIKN